jgi:hypothetical protein
MCCGADLDVVPQRARQAGRQAAALRTAIRTRGVRNPSRVSGADAARGHIHHISPRAPSYPCDGRGKCRLHTDDDASARSGCSCVLVGRGGVSRRDAVVVRSALFGARGTLGGLIFRSPARLRAGEQGKCRRCVCLQRQKAGVLGAGGPAGRPPPSLGLVGVELDHLVKELPTVHQRFHADPLVQSVRTAALRVVEHA